MIVYLMTEFMGVFLLGTYEKTNKLIKVPIHIKVLGLICQFSLRPSDGCHALQEDRPLRGWQRRLQ